MLLVLTTIVRGSMFRLHFEWVRGEAIVQIDIRDTATDGPVYQQIKDQVTELIKAGTLSAGEALPPPATIATQCSVDRGEVSRAYFELEQLGLVASKKSKNFLGEATVSYVVV